MPSNYRYRVAAVLAFFLCFGTAKGAAAFETKAKSAVSAPTSISRITTKKENGRMVAIIETNGKPTYKTYSLHTPERVVMDIIGATSAVTAKGIEVAASNLERIRVGEQDTKLRIVFDLKEQANFEVRELGNSLAIYFTEPNTKISEHKKAINNPPVAPPDTVSEGSTEKKSKSDKADDSAKVEDKKEGDNRTPSTLPSVKGPSARPGIARAAVRPAVPTTATADNPAGEPQGPKTRFGEPGFTGEPISIDIASVDINDLLRFISDQFGENFILDKSVGSVNVTVKVNDVPWDQVLETIFKANQLSYTRETSIVRVVAFEALAKEQEAKQRLKEQEINSIPKQSKFFRLKYSRLTNVSGGQGGGIGQNQGGGGGAGGGSTSSLGGTTAGAGGATGLISIIKKNLSKVGEVDGDPRTNQIIVTDIPQSIEKIEEIINKLDVAEPQVEIEARVVLANRSFMRQIGNQLFLASTQTKTVSVPDGKGGFINKSLPGFGGVFETSPQFLGSAIRTDGQGSSSVGGNTGGSNNINNALGLIGSPANGNLAGAASSVLSLTTGVIGTSILSTAISASEQKGLAKTIASPRVTVQNNIPADITSGTQIPVQTEVNNTITTTFVTAALRLSVTPQIADEGNVLLRIIVENNSVDRSLRTTGGTPSISTQRAETLVLVPDGGTTILGGVNLDMEDNVVTRTPGVARVPFLGELFKKRQVDRMSTELLFFVTPRIYKPETLGAQSAPPTPTQQPVVSPEVAPQTGGER